MSARVGAVALGAVGLALTIGLHVLDVMNDRRFAPPTVGTIVLLSFLVVGALVAWHRPRNPIGWIYLVSATLVSFGGEGNFAAQYAAYALVTHPGSLPAPDWVLLAGKTVLLIGFFSLIFFPLLLFPNGRLPSRRWRPVGIAAVAAAALLPLGRLTQDGLKLGALTVANPLRAGGTAFPSVSGLDLPFIIIEAAIGLACLGSPFVRFRAATGVERQQLKWFALGAACIPAMGVTGLVLSQVAPAVADSVRASLWPLSIAGIPIATAIAILRYRLYDIDVIIRRTLVYGATTAGIALAFFAGTVVLQALLRPLTSGSELAVAASTLASVALFQPLRSRVQQAVDRRFYRSRYDAARTLDAFSVRLRDEVDLDAVRAELLDAVAQTVQPADASVWLRAARR